jgi:hypothetical protein
MGGREVLELAAEEDLGQSEQLGAIADPFVPALPREAKREPALRAPTGRRTSPAANAMCAPANAIRPMVPSPSAESPSARRSM